MSTTIEQDRINRLRRRMIDLAQCDGHATRDILAVINEPAQPRGLRDEFAMHAMQAIVSHPDMVVALKSKTEVAKAAYGLADIMLQARAA